MNPAALSEARAADARRREHERVGPLNGVPIVDKDSVNMAGLPTTAGYSGFAPEVGGLSLIPEENAPVVQRLLAAGAVILGKTNIPAFSDSGDNANSIGRVRRTTRWTVMGARRVLDRHRDVRRR